MLLGLQRMIRAFPVLIERFKNVDDDTLL